MGVIKNIVIIWALLMLAGCAGVTAQGRGDLARHIAAEGRMVPRVMTVDGFDLTLYTRITAPAEQAVVYIEGDGLAWRGRRMPSADPTPINPVALRLAAQDPAPNVIYMARPCQYTSGRDCDPLYWTTGRFAPGVIMAMDRALDMVLEEQDIEAVRLVGFSGGAAVAGLLASRRGDVVDFRSVAGNLDPAMHSALHRVTPLSASLNPAVQAGQEIETLRAVKQIHFIGQDDRNVTAEIYESYARKIGGSCTQMMVVANASHEKGWVEEWPRLLSYEPVCE